MLNVFLTVDTELWPCSADWRKTELAPDLQRDIVGVTDEGDFGVPYQIDLLNAHDLKAVFFVESLFASVVGAEPLRQIVSMIEGRGQEVQLHLHPEWLRHMRPPLVPDRRTEYLKDYTEDEQAELVAAALANLRAAGASNVTAFRAGNYGANFDTLRALARVGLPVDMSHNHCYRHSACDMPTDDLLLQPCRLFGVHEFPITFFRDYPGHFRHVQLCACSSGELENALLTAWRQGWHSLVLVSHSFELLKDRKRHDRPQAPDWFVIRRFERLCRFLAYHRDKFRTVGANDVDLVAIPSVPPAQPLRSPLRYTGSRVLEQLVRRMPLRGLRRLATQHASA
jgi:hypothetical protein